MDENAEIAAEIRAWLHRTMAAKALTISDWASKAGIARTTIARAAKEGYPFVTSSRTLVKLADAANVEPPVIRGAQQRPADARIVPKFLPVRYRARAGTWVEVEFSEPPLPETYAVAPDPRFSSWPQWLELIEGDSANLKIPHGHLAHVVDAIEMGYVPRDGNWVIVERRRNQGAERERSVKQVRVRPDGGVELWPRSSNAAWNKPLRLNSAGPRIVSVGGVDPEEGEEIEVEIVGLVIGAYDPDFL